MLRTNRHFCAYTALLTSILAIAISLSAISQRPVSLVALAAKISPAVVAVECERSPFPLHSGGSGVIVGLSDMVVTNFHIVKNATSIKVMLYNGQSVPARLVGGDETADLAVLRLIGVSGLPHLRLGRAEDLQVGQRVVSLGNAHGLGASGEPSMTAGIVSGKHRRPKGPEWYEMDAQIYPGNSGGPVCDMSGDIVGINVAISTHLKSFFVPLDAKRRAILLDLSNGLIGG